MQNVRVLLRTRVNLDRDEYIIIFHVRSRRQICHGKTLKIISAIMTKCVSVGEIEDEETEWQQIRVIARAWMLSA